MLRPILLLFCFTNQFIMARKKTLIIVFSIIFIIIGGGGGFILYKMWPATWERGAPSMGFPIADTDAIHILSGYGQILDGFTQWY